MTRLVSLLRLWHHLYLFFLYYTAKRVLFSVSFLFLILGWIIVEFDGFFYPLFLGFMMIMTAMMAFSLSGGPRAFVHGISPPASVGFSVESHPKVHIHKGNSV